MEYKNKYLKYKSKYLQLKELYGGLIKITPNVDLRKAGLIKQDEQLNELKTTDKLTSSYFLDNNKYFENSGNITNKFTLSEKTKLKEFFEHLHKYENKSLLVNDVFQNKFFSLDENYKYQTTLKRENDRDYNLIKCDKFIWTKGPIKEIKCLKIIKEDDIFKAKDEDNNILLDNSDLNELFKIISTQYKIEDSNFDKTKCTEFTTNKTFKNITNEHNFKKSFLINEEDLITLGPKFFIIKSKKLLYYDEEIFIIIDYKLDSTNQLKEIILKPKISQININVDYAIVFKKLFDFIADSINEYMKSEIIKVLPFSFYHIHITKVKDEKKILLIIHASNEDLTNGPTTNFTYNSNIVTFKNMHEVKNDDDKTTIRNHNHLLLIDLENMNNMKLYSIKENETKNVNRSNRLFSFTIGSNFGFLAYNIFGKHIADLSYFKEKNNPMNMVFNDDLNDVEFSENSSYIYDDSPDENLCAKYSYREKSIFIDDIKVDEIFKNCTLGLKKIIEKFEKLGKDTGKKYLELDDASFMQFPDTYTSDIYAKYKWCVAYLKANPRMPSIYTTIGFTLKDAKSKEEILKELERIVNEYNKTNSYDLVLNANKLQYTARNIKLGKDCIESEKCFCNEEYKEKLDKYDEEYRNFNEYVFEKYSLLDGIKNQVTELYNLSPVYSAMFKLLHLDEYIKEIK